MKNKNNMPQILEVNEVANSSLFKIEKIKLKFSNGVERDFERLKGWPPGVVMIAPFIDNETILLIREYAAGINQYTLSLPKGRVEVGEGLEVAANRELQEEAGYKANKLDLISSLTTSPQYNDTHFHIYVAQDLIPSKLPADEPEPLEIVPWKIKDLPKLLARDDVHEARTIAALFLVRDFMGA
jgi:ADP-ribose diphosphatase